MDVRDIIRRPAAKAAPARNEDACLLVLDEALRSLARLDALKHAVLEMRFFLGLTADQTAVALAISPERATRELRLAQAWLRREVARRTSSPADAPRQESARIRSTTRSTS